jgi:hypothetical protein
VVYFVPRKKAGHRETHARGQLINKFPRRTRKTGNVHVRPLDEYHPLIMPPFGDNFCHAAVGLECQLRIGTTFDAFLKLKGDAMQRRNPHGRPLYWHFASATPINVYGRRSL